MDHQPNKNNNCSTNNTKQLTTNQLVSSSYVVIKHSWKGKYKRVLVIDSEKISTFDPKSLRPTNSWSFDSIIDFGPIGPDLFKLVIKKRNTNNTEILKFSSDFRSNILCDIIKFRPKTHSTAKNAQTLQLQYECNKFHRLHRDLPAMLIISQNSVIQTDPHGNILTCYYFNLIDSISILTSNPRAISITTTGFGRTHLFTLMGKLNFTIKDENKIREDFITNLNDTCMKNIGISIPIRRETRELDQIYSERFGPKFSKDEMLTSMHEFNVRKINQRHLRRPVERVLCLATSCVIERDPDTYQLVTLKPLNDIFALIRSPSNPQMFSIEFSSINTIISYTTTERDALLASLVDSARSSGNTDIHVKMCPTNLGWRCGPYVADADDEIERGHLKAFQMLPQDWTFTDVIYRFNTICPYSGLMHSAAQDAKLFSENKARLIETALMCFIEQSENGSIPIHTSNKNYISDIEQYYQAIRRLVATKPGFAFFNQNDRFRGYLGRSIVRTFKLNNDAITYAGIDVLCALMQPMHPDCDIRNEQQNKHSLLATKEFLENLIDVLKTHIERGTAALVVAAMLDFLTYALCSPYSETTESSCFDSLLNMVAVNGREIYKLFQHPSLAIVKGAGLVIKAIIHEGEPNVSKRMQELSLAEGALLKHLHVGLFSQFKSERTSVQYLSRYLVALWSIDNEETKALFKRMFPLGLINYLDSCEKPTESMIATAARCNLTLANKDTIQESIIVSKINTLKELHPSVKNIERQLDHAIMHWREKIGVPKKEDRPTLRPVVLRKCRERVKIVDNWDMFYFQFYQDHSRPDLIWNWETRKELKAEIEKELGKFTNELATKDTIISWNYLEFEVNYQTLAKEIKIGGYFLRLLLEDSHSLVNNINIKVPYNFFIDLYHRFLINKDVDMRCSCLQAMSTVYEHYKNEIGPFNDVYYLVNTLKNCRNKIERDRLIILLEKLVVHKANAKELIKSDGIKTLVELITLAHLHTQRANIPTQSNSIEATTEMLAAAATKEWYYCNDKSAVSGRDELPYKAQKVHSSHLGPFRAADIEKLWKEQKVDEQTKFCAQGTEGWKSPQEIPQLKWLLMSSSNPVMNETELATKILGILIRVCEYYPSYDFDGAIVRPLPKIKEFLSDSTCLPHIVQLLVTFDPTIVDKVANLISLITEENPMVSQLHKTGLYFFILMYSGSNLSSVGHLLSATHLTQKDPARPKKFLTYLLPEAMICYLENHGPEKFINIFLGEFDTPEAIWNSEMRRSMIDKIACHVAAFTSRLKSNNRATYKYLPIAPISYDQLEDELFVDIYYLRNLCDTVKFYNWPIKDPFNLLKALLDAWREEAARKPSTLSFEEALRTLHLDPEKFSKADNLDEESIKRAHKLLARKYHPDKNPEGEAIFIKIQAAYDYLSSKEVRKQAMGVNPKNLILIFKAQSILFSQCNKELHPYKYSGYPMLIQTVKAEIDDERLFSKQDPLLAYACETCYYTLRCSAKNAEELRRENGLEILEQSLSRCASVLSGSSDPNDKGVSMCQNIIRCFAIASEFEACQQKLSELNTVVKEINRLLSYTKLHELMLISTECAAAFANCSPLKDLLYNSGIIFSLILLFFKYDFTLEESGIERNEGHNKQEIVNQTAKTALVAIARLYEHCAELYRKPVEALLSYYISNQLLESQMNAHEILKMLNSNVEIPYFIWNNGTRAELTDYLEKHQTVIIQSGECDDESYGANFVMSCLEDELMIGHIYVRVFNRQPTYPLTNADEFVLALLSYIGNQSQFIQSALALEDPEKLDPKRITHVEDALKALSLAVKSNPGVEVKCIGYFKLLFSLLAVHQLPEVQEVALEVIKNIVSNKDCVDDIANSEVVIYLLMILYVSCHKNTKQIDDGTQTPEEKSNVNTAVTTNARCITILDVLLSLVGNSRIVKESIAKGILIYLTDLFCNCSDSVLRFKCSDLMARITYDKLSGFQASLILCKFLPMVIVDAMKNSARDAVNLFDNNQENPELIWNSNTRTIVCESLQTISQDLHNNQVENLQHTWQLEANFNLNTLNPDELVIAGVYLRLFNLNPTWVLRKPREFLTELMNAFQEMIKYNIFEDKPMSPKEDHVSSKESRLETITTALKNLLIAQPILAESVPAMGHIQSIIEGVYSKSKKSVFVSKCCLSILCELGSSRACVDIMSTNPHFITELKSSMTEYKDVVDVCCFALRKIFQFSAINDKIVQQALETNFLNHLLNHLSDNGSAQTRALIVQVLKSMTENQTYGQQVETVLSKSKIWADYSDQRHDLFISNEPSLTAIEAPASNIAGYLQGYQ